MFIMRSPSRYLTIIITLLAIHFTALTVDGNDLLQPAQAYREEVKRVVLGIVQCSNPEILVDVVKDEINGVELFQKHQRLPFDFMKVKLGKNIVGYRADFTQGGSGWSGYRRAWLFELHGSVLQLVFDLQGYYLFISDTTVVNGRYILWHWEGSDPRSVKQRSYEWGNGKYLKGPLVHLK